MKATIKINMDNAAFEPNNGIELASILYHLANKCEAKEELKSGDTFAARDVNGNRVGELKVSK